MSQTACVDFRGRNLWAYDVSFSILIAELVGVVDDMGSGCPDWLKAMLPDLRAAAILGADVGLSLDGFGLTDKQLDELVGFMADTNRRLIERGTVTAEEAQRWVILDGNPVIWRGADLVPTAPIAELGEAVIRLVQGTLPRPPRGTWWCFGWPGGPFTLAMREEGLGPSG